MKKPELPHHTLDALRDAAAPLGYDVGPAYAVASHRVAGYTVSRLGDSRPEYDAATLKDAAAYIERVSARRAKTKHYPKAVCFSVARGTDWHRVMVTEGDSEGEYDPRIINAYPADDDGLRQARDEAHRLAAAHFAAFRVDEYEDGTCDIEKDEAS